MRLISMRRLIMADNKELLELIERTKNHCGGMSEGDVLQFLTHGRVEGAFLNGELGAVAFCADKPGFCTDSLFRDIVKTSSIRYIRAFYDECLLKLLCSPQGEKYTVIHYRHIADIAPFIGDGYELLALRGGIANKPYLLLQRGDYGAMNRDMLNGTCGSLLYGITESKELSRRLDEGYRGIGVEVDGFVLAKSASV